MNKPVSNDQGAMKRPNNENVNTNKPTQDRSGGRRVPANAPVDRSLRRGTQTQR